VRGGLYEEWGCAEVGLPTRSRFEDFPADGLATLETKDFTCAVALYLDSSGIARELKFKHLASQARRGDKWGTALGEFMAELDWQMYVDYIYRHSEVLGPGEWERACRGAARHYQKSPAVKAYPPRLLRLFFEQAQRNGEPGTRLCMTSTFNEPQVPVEQALTLAKRMSVEESATVRGTILRVQTQHDDSRTNRVIREFLRGPVDLTPLELLCRGDHIEHSGLVERNRYDFLPDLQALRERLATEKDVRKRFEAKKAIAILEPAIAALEKRKKENAPICPAEGAR